MNNPMKNTDLEMELVIRTRGYQITLDVLQGIARLTRVDDSDWHVSLRCKEGVCEIC